MRDIEVLSVTELIELVPRGYVTGRVPVTQISDGNYNGTHWRDLLSTKCSFDLSSFVLSSFHVFPGDSPFIQGRISSWI